MDLTNLDNGALGGKDASDGEVRENTMQGTGRGRGEEVCSQFGFEVFRIIMMEGIVFDLWNDLINRSFIEQNILVIKLTTIAMEDMALSK